MSSSNNPGRARKVLGVLGSVVGVTVTFVVGVAAAAVIHLDVPATRRLVATQANGILKSTLQGEVHVDRIGHIGLLDGVSGIKVRVKDPTGLQVLDVTGVKVQANAVSIARSALFGKGPIVIDVPLAKIDHIDANLDTDGTPAQNLRLANAFQPRDQTPKPNEPPGRGVRVEAPDIRIGHAWTHGYPPGGQPVDADIRNLAARAHLDPQRVDAVLTQVALEARAVPRGLDPKGVVAGKFSMPLEGEKPPMAIEASFDGRVGNIPTTVKGSMKGERVDAVVDAHDDTGTDASALVSEVTIRDALRVHAEAHGDLPHLDTKANVALGRATVDATAAIVTGPTTKITGAVSVRNVDVSALEPSAPKTELGLDARADIAIGESGIAGTASVDTLPGFVNQQKVPKIEVRAKVAGKTGHATVTIPDPQMKTKVDIALAPHGDNGQFITAKVDSDIPDLYRLPYVGAQVGGSATIEADAKLTLPEKAIDAKAKVEVHRVRNHDLTLGIAKNETTVTGTLDRPVIDTRLESRDLLTGTLPLAKLDAGAHIVIEGSAVEITDVSARAVRPTTDPIVATAKLVKIAGPELRVDGATVTGLGEPIHADVVKNGDDIDGAVSAPAINLRLVSRVLGKEEELGIETGTLAIDAKGGLHERDVKAGAHVELRDFASKEVRNASAKIDAAIDGKEVALDANAHVGDAGEVSLKTDHFVIGGHASDPASWKKAHGRLDLDAAVDLTKLEALVPEGVLPVSDLHGDVVVQARLGRDSAEAPPEIQMHAHTLNLAFSGKPEKSEPPMDGVKVTGPAPWRSVGVDFGVDVRNDATSGLTNVAFHVTDPHGALVAFDSKTILPYDELMRDPASAKAKILAAPISARMTIPARRLEDLPSIAEMKDTAGSIEAELEAGGTVLDPHVRFIMKGRGLRTAAMPRDTKSDADVALDYDGQEAKLAVKASARGQDLLTVAANATVKARDFIVGTPHGGEPEWAASARAHLASFPLDSIPQLAQQRVKGRISGDVALEDLHKDARVTGHIALDQFKVGRVEYEKGNIDLEAGRGKLDAKVRIEQKDGYIDASAANGLNWGTALAPSLDAKKPLQAKLEAKNFRAAAIQPFVASAVPTLDGRIDANAHATVTPGKPGAELDGKVVFRDGTVLPAALGEELRKVRATVTLAKDGTIRLDDVSASGISGEVHAKGMAKLDGMRLADATVDVDIPKDKAFDFALQGEPLGEMYGTIRLKASQSADAKVTKLAIEVPKLNIELPQALKTGVETLDKKDNVRVGVYRDRTDFVELPLDKQDTLPPPEKREKDPSRLDIDVRLGRIEVKRGNQARVGLAGNLKVSVGLDTRITGEVHALDGWADVQGKKFTVEKATVTFNGNPEINPIVMATATWTAVDGTKVFADFIGPVKTGKVVLRSEPARPRNEILALVLFGTADGANPTPSAPQSQKDSTTKTAVGVGGGIAAQGLTDALDDMAGIQATVRVDTTSSTNPRPEVEFQVSPKVAIAFGHVLGTPPITEPDTNLAKLSYRFHRNWSAETTVGDKGKAQFDAVWQKRY